MKDSVQTFADMLDGRKNNFDFIRVFLACLVIISHSFFLIDTKSEPLERLTHGQITLGTVAVRCFFVISGFLITMSWIKCKGILDYLQRRVSRIYPGFAVAIIVCVCIIGPLGATNVRDYMAHVHPLSTIIQILRLHQIPELPTLLDNPSPRSLNGSLWSIGIEFECYILVIILGLIGFFKRRWPVVIVFIISWIMLIGDIYHISGLRWMIKYIPDFATQKNPLINAFVSGMIFYLYREKIVFSKTVFILCCLIFVLSLFAEGIVCLFPIVGAYILLYCAFTPSIKLHHWGKYMDVSYGVYLYGWPVEQILIHYFKPHLSPLLLMTMTIPITACLGAISWFAIEKPCMQRKKVST